MFYCPHIEHMHMTFTDLDASLLQETILIEGDGLRQWTDGEKLVVQVENLMMEDVLLLQFTDISKKQNMVKVFCPQHHPKLQTGNINKHSDSYHGLDAPDHNEFPFIQWSMPESMSEQSRPCPKEIILASLPDTTSTSASTPEEKIPGDILDNPGTRTTQEYMRLNAAAEITESNSEARHQLEQRLSNTENKPETTKAATPAEASMISDVTIVTNKATETLTEPETLSSKNLQQKKEPYTTIVEMTTPPADTHTTANTAPVNFTTTTPNCMASLNQHMKRPKQQQQIQTHR
ncbi:hypothetical protein Baya_15846 [Bagarius yarrelli]|uniref:Uncharacterized protein n=1 Tax=Bagarius yarrelli TaxID=175774 RepID=A0A556VCU6_BAGYA|nr:hypothetical protein Baya_15846 [Bagarius yarrelli]